LNGASSECTAALGHTLSGDRTRQLLRLGEAGFVGQGFSDNGLDKAEQAVHTGPFGKRGNLRSAREIAAESNGALSSLRTTTLVAA
jgi:hypothetical protein